MGTDPIVLVILTRHPKWTHRVNRRTGRVVVTAGPRTTRITITAKARRADSLYGPHVWTRTWAGR